MTREDEMQYWREGAERDWKTAEDLYKLGRYDACLFFCHLSLEKLLKGFVVRKTQEASPRIHDLGLLAELAGLHASEEQKENFRGISAFNIAGRYPEEKHDFYKKCTREYTDDWRSRADTLRLWILENFQ